MHVPTPLFVTGATGFVGRRLVRLLSPGQRAKTTVLLRTAAPGPPERKVATLRGDLLDPDGYADRIPTGSTVLHLAARTGRATPEEFFAVNLEGTRDLLRASRGAGVRRFVFVSSVAARFREIGDYPYARSKLAAERAVRESGLPATVVRPTIVAGRGGGAWESLLRLARLPVIPLPGGGRVGVQPVAVGDVARLLLTVAASEACADRTLEIGGPEPVSVAELLRRMHRAARGRDPAILPLPAAPVVACARLLERVLGPRAPATAGQLRSLLEDGTAVPDLAFPDDPAGLVSLDEMIRVSVEGEGRDTPAGEAEGAGRA